MTNEEKILALLEKHGEALQRLETAVAALKAKGNSNTPVTSKSLAKERPEQSDINFTDYNWGSRSGNGSGPHPPPFKH